MKYNGITFDRRMTWRLHIERTAPKALATYTRTYSRFKSARLNINIELTLHKALIRTIMVYACLTGAYTENAHLLKLKSLQNPVLRAVGNFDRHTPVRKMHMAPKSPYVYDYIIKSCRKQKSSKIA
jgi:hypothetical protein